MSVNHLPCYHLPHLHLGKMNLVLLKIIAQFHLYCYYLKYLE